MIFPRIKRNAVLCSLLLLGLRSWGDVRLDLFVGYDGHTTQDSWFPVTLEVQNNGPSFVATIDIADRGVGSGIRRSVTLELPTGTLKRVLLPDFRSQRFVADFEATLKDARGRVLATAIQPVKNHLAPGGLMVASLSASSAGAVHLPAIIEGDRGQRRGGTARLLPAFVPDNPLALEGLRVLYLNTTAALELQAGQVEAIRRWVEHGGRLVVCVQQISDLTVLSWLRDMLPALPTSGTMRSIGSALHSHALQGWHDPTLQTPLGMKPGTFDALGRTAEDEGFSSAEFPVWEFRLHREARTLLSGPGAPLAVVRRQGWGEVVLLAFNPEREPFLGWRHRDWLWATICGGKEWFVSFQNSYTQNSTDSLFGIHVDSRQIRKLPVGWLLLLLLSYLVVIGPLDRWWLKRIRREMLTWITFPCYVIAFSLIIYFIGSQLRSGETEWNEAQVIDLLEPGRNSMLRVHSFGSVYSPANRRFEFSNDRGISSLRLERGAEGGFHGDRVLLSQTGGVYQATAQVAVWTSQMFVQEGYSSNVAVLQVSVTGRNDNQLQVQFDNRSPYTIETPVLVAGGSIYSLEPLLPGVTEQIIKIDRDREGTSMERWFRSHAQPVQGMLNQRRRTFGGDEARPGAGVHLLDSLMCASFPNEMPRSGNESYPNFFLPLDPIGMGRMMEQEDCVFLGLIPGKALVPEFAQFKRGRGHVDTLIRALIHIKPTQEAKR